jgi:AcrR family transcriptional regulator
MAYDSAATKLRLLDAAYDEFVAHGLAGARVDRIARSAKANKQAIYLYFGSKDALFDAVLDTRLQVLADVVPFTPDDLPGYAGALFDYFGNNEGLVRLTQWKALEQPEASESEREAHQSKAEALAAVHGSDEEHGADAMMLALAAARAWGGTAPAIRNPLDAPEAERRARHRAALVAAVEAAVGTVLPAVEGADTAGVPS